MADEIKPIPGSPQERMCQSSVREVGFGGQAGGAKSFGLVLDALYQLHLPNYNAIMFRRTYKQLMAADGLVDLSARIYPSLGGDYNKTNYTWTFPRYHNNTIRFSYLEDEKSIEDTSGPQYAWIGFDELGNFNERPYLFMFSRNRSSNPAIRCYIRSTFNPGGIGHFWIKKRFIDTDIVDAPKYFKRVDGRDTITTKDDPLGTARLFIPSRLEDNPYLWRDGNSDYERGLSQLDSVDFRRLRHGDWDIRRSGLVYNAFVGAGPLSTELDYSKVEGWYHSHDFGAVNHAWGLFAKIGSTYYLVYEEMLPEGTTARRAERIKAHFTDRKIVAGWGGAKSEQQQRRDFANCGISLREPPIVDVEAQVDAANRMLEAGELVICSDMSLTIDQLQNCVRDDKEGIQDKNIWHHLDVLRYFAGGIRFRGVFVG